MTPPLVPSSPGKSELAYLYIAHNTFEHGVHQWYKVGITCDLATRRRTLRSTGNVGQFVMLKAWQLPAASAKPIEKAIHIRLDEEGLRVTRDREFFAGPWPDLAERIVRILAVLSPAATETILPPLPPPRSRKKRGSNEPHHRQDSLPVQQERATRNHDPHDEPGLVLPGGREASPFPEDKEYWDEWDRRSAEEHKAYESGEAYWKTLRDRERHDNRYPLNLWRHAFFATREELRTSIYALSHLAPVMPATPSQPWIVAYWTLQDTLVHFSHLPSPARAAYLALAQAQACARGQFSFQMSCAEANRTLPAPEEMTKRKRHHVNQVPPDLSPLLSSVGAFPGPWLRGLGGAIRFPGITDHYIIYKVAESVGAWTAESAEVWFAPDYAIDIGLMGKDGPLPTNVPLPPELAEEVISLPDAYPWVHYLYHAHKQSQRGISALRIFRPAMDRSAEQLHGAAAWLSERGIVVDRRLLDAAVDSEITT